MKPKSLSVWMHYGKNTLQKSPSFKDNEFPSRASLRNCKSATNGSRLPKPSGFPPIMIRSCFAIFAFVFCCNLSAEPIHCRVVAPESSGNRGIEKLNVKANDDTTEVRGSASILIIPEGTIGAGDWVLELEYFCVGEVDQMSISIESENGLAASQSLNPFGHSEAYRPYIAKLEETTHFKLSGVKRVHLDLIMKDDAVLQIRSVQLRRQKPGEFDMIAESLEHAADTRVLESYLSRSFSSHVSRVSVGKSEIKIAGTVGENLTTVFLGDIAIETLLGSASPYRELVEVLVQTDGTFEISLPRTTTVDGRIVDRLTDRWQLYRHNQSGHAPISHSHYADEVNCRRPELPAAKPKSKKGLGGWAHHREPELKNELKDLGIAAVTVNVAGLHQYVSTQPRRGFTRFTWQGRDYYANQRELGQLDETFREAEANDVMVSVILLVTNPEKSKEADGHRIAHPDADPSAMFAMPAVTSSEGIDYYGAILNLMADRWSRSDGVHGRVHHWIVHNEIDFGWVWTNAGEKSDVAFMDLYQRSMRLVDLIVRQYDSNARAWISLTHHWADRGNRYGYGSKRMLELLVQFCEVEGDFPWALAYHPYPESLFNPRTWEDKHATFDFNTAKITPMNVEVLDAYMKLPKNRYQGKVRPVHLSENGFNSRDYSVKSQDDQAAGMALAWKKIQHLSSIESWQYHNWIDNRHEGGLRIGLRKFPDDKSEPLGKKPIWHLYQALGTPREDVITNRYLKTIGILSWDEVTRRPLVQ